MNDINEEHADDPKFTVLKSVGTYVGIYFSEQTIKHWEFECPCGVRVSYPINVLPEVNTQFPCDNKNHWVIKFGE